ncbi:flagellar motor protein MotB, partial [Rhizorhabdus wittichii]|uniref:flagellar motor protein MotB n=1 Tax=Rhizorhabdus wittichii TaxID=160791 RepID=UPI00178C79DE
MSAARAPRARRAGQPAPRDRPPEPEDRAVRREISQRWVLSFADLTLLLLAFFVLMQAQAADRLKLAAGIRDAFGGDGAD